MLLTKLYVFYLGYLNVNTSFLPAQNHFFAKVEGKTDESVSSFAIKWAYNSSPIANMRKKNEIINEPCIQVLSGESFSSWFYKEQHWHKSSEKKVSTYAEPNSRGSRKRRFCSQQMRNEYYLILYSTVVELLRRFQA